ncbi:fimbrillin family protein [Bacteroides xylanisolvens]|uniref:fimbrillin family protein n=1 Tax=Bacteroides xylanisolvens TaxID=371601 RepID=UPI0022EAD045|nr:fimbrillin family protein [Bacteroides xylanisolvens]
MIHYKFLSTALLLGSIVLWSSCSNIEEDLSVMSGNKGLTINVQDMGLENVEPSVSRAVTDANYNTTFEIGDCIGLFAVKDNAILSDVNNLKVEFTREGWLPVTELQYDGTLKDAVFYAYFPYKESLSINSVEADFFASTVTGWNIGKDQSTKKNFADSDLMTSSGSTINRGDKGEFLIQLNMAHRMSLAVISLPGTEYKFTNPELQGTTYAVKPSGDVAFYTEKIADDKEIKPYRADDGSYRMLVKPDQLPNIVGVLGESKYKVNSAIAAGKYKRFMVDGGNVIKEYELKVGDFYCADGNLVSVDAGEIPDDCIGIVYYVGNPQPSVLYKDNEDLGADETKDALKRDFPNCVHGLVYAVKNGNNNASARFAGNSKGDYAGLYKNSEELNTAYLWGQSSDSGNFINNSMLGYNNTEILRIMIKTTANLADEMFINRLEPYATLVPAPVQSSGWYLPSFGELKVILEKQDVISASLNKVNGDALWHNDFMHWSSTCGGTGVMWQTNDTGAARSNTKNSKGYFRFSLAF